MDADIVIGALDEDSEGYPLRVSLEVPEEGFERVFEGCLPAKLGEWKPTGKADADGEFLFDALFAGEGVPRAWTHLSETLRAPEGRVRLRLQIDQGAPALHALPWELMQREGLYLSAQAGTAFSRYLPAALPWRGRIEARPVRVLVVIPDPSDLEATYGLAPVDVAAERANLEAALTETDPIEADFLTGEDEPVTLARLRDALGEDCHILHFVGHGAFNARRGQASLYMQGEDGSAQRVPDADLIAMLTRHGVQPQMVFLVACQSATRSTVDAFAGLGPKLVQSGVPAVVAMQDVVTIETARIFGAAFYRQLIALEGQADFAGCAARAHLLDAGRLDAAVPVLLTRLKSGQLWSGEADMRGEVLGEDEPRVFWTTLIGNIQRGKCLPIIGPRVQSRWFPSQREIAECWAEKHGYPFSDKGNLSRVAQYIASNAGADVPRREYLETLFGDIEDRLAARDLLPEGEYATLGGLIRQVGWETLGGDNPNEIHGVLASLGLPLYLTTNFDSLMAAALAGRGQTPAREICRWNEHLNEVPSLFEEDPNYTPTAEAPMVYHLFGGCSGEDIEDDGEGPPPLILTENEELDAMVLTEDDYMDFLVRIAAESERIPYYIQGALASSSLMFLGYSLHDWEFRVIMRGLVANLPQRRQIKHVGVQLEPGDVVEENREDVQRFLQRYFQTAEINVYWGTVQQFMAELRGWWAQAQAESAPRARRTTRRSRARR